MPHFCNLTQYASNTSEEDLQRLIGSDLVIQQAYEALNQFNWNEQELIAYEQEIKRIRDNRAAFDYQYDKGKTVGKAEGVELGMEQGKTKEKIKIAKNLLSQNIDIQIISSATGLSTDEIKKLQK